MTPICGGCGEAANTADCGSVTRGFEPHHSPHFFYPEFHMGVSPSGKATDFDSVIGGPTPPTPASHQILQFPAAGFFAWK